MSERARDRRGSPKSAGEAFVGALMSGLWLWAVNAHELWRPWTKGVVTEDWLRVLWALNLAGVVQVAGNLSMVVFRAPLFGRLVEVVLAAAGVLGSLVLYEVFPFDFSKVAGPWLTTVVLILLLLGVVGSAIGVLVAVVRVFTGGPRPTRWAERSS